MVSAAFPAQRAAAHTDACVGQGTMVTSAGLGLPGVWPQRSVTFSMVLSFGTCAATPGESMAGVLVGNCYAAWGTGTTSSGHPFRITWTGDTWVMGASFGVQVSPVAPTFAPMAPGVTSNAALVGAGDMSPDPTVPGSCFNATAQRFLVTGTWSAPLHPTPSPPPPPNYPPGAPTMVSPPAGHTFTFADTQQFTIQATDAEGDPYQGRIRVTDAATNLVVATYFTTRAPSGTPATAVAVPPLPAGSYTWVADATDDLTPTSGYGSASGPRAFSVTGPPLPPRYPSDDCAAGTTYEDGYVGGVYTRLRTTQVAPGTTAVCFRAETGGLGLGGKVTFAGGSTPSPTAPSVDGDASACATTSGNDLPPPHPVFSGSLGDPADPSTYVPFAVDLYASASYGGVCLTVGTTGRRVLVPVPQTGAPPAVTFELDAPATHLPAPTPNGGSASGACQSATTGTTTRHVNANGALGGTWLHTWQEPSGTVHVCVRALGTGGRLTVNSPGGGPTPTVATSLTDTSACTLRVAGIDTPTTVEVRRSASLTDPSAVSFCVVAGTTRARVTVGASGSASVPPPTWTPDS